MNSMSIDQYRREILKQQNKPMAAKRNKFNAQKVELDGMTFDSKKEHRRYIELKAMQQRGEIFGLEHHTKFELAPKTKLEGEKRAKPALRYFADFTYYFDQQDDTMDSIRHEELTLFLSFYGDHGQSIANVLRDGLAIPQNIAQLKAQQIKFISTGEIITAPDFLNNQYVHRYDLTAVFKRKTSRTFAVKSFVDAGKIKLNQE